MKSELLEMQEVLLAAMSDVGGMAQNLGEADDWAKEGFDEEAALSLEAVSTGATDATERLRRIALKCEEICATVKARAAK